MTGASVEGVVSRRPLPLLAAIVALGLALRLRFQAVPLNADESGYAYVARLWSQGYRLYGPTAWVDRGEGLMGAYRLALVLGADQAVRSLALVAATVTTVGLYAIGTALASRPVGLVAAGLFAVLSPAPNIEGFTANGELLSEAVVVVAVVLVLAWRRRRAPWLLVAAGAAAGTAPFVKQSAADAALVVLAVVGAELAASPRAERLRLGLRWLVLTGAGAAVPVGLCVGHGAAVGLHDWWFALVGYRAGTESVLSGDYAYRLREFKDSLVSRDPRRAAALRAPALRARRCPAPADPAGARGLGAGGVPRLRRGRPLPPPLLDGARAGALRPRGPRPRGGAAAPRDPGPGGRRRRARRGDGRLLLEAVHGLVAGRAVAALDRRRPPRLGARGGPLHRRPHPALGPDLRHLGVHLRLLARDRASAYRVLWYRGVQEIAGAAAGARAVFTGAHPPAAVAIYQGPHELDPTGTIEGILRTRYAPPVRVAGIPVYLLRDGPA